MKSIFAATLFLAAAGLAHAGQPGPDWINFSAVTQHLQSAGYSNISEVEADDGYWKAHAVKEGQLFKVVLDPRSGNIVSATPKREDD